MFQLESSLSDKTIRTNSKIKLPHKNTDIKQILLSENFFSPKEYLKSNQNLGHSYLAVYLRKYLYLRDSGKAPEAHPNVSSRHNICYLNEHIRFKETTSEFTKCLLYCKKL